MTKTAKTPGSRAEIASELVKLLLQVAWADHDVAPAEAEALMAYARRAALPEAELAALQAMLTGRAPLAPPNLGLLKQHRTEALRAMKELLLSDLAIADEEEQLLAQVSELLR
jgi:uncharacterized tellurite resistance protein B-like protein